jgi:hypothetical protein
MKTIFKYSSCILLLAASTDISFCAPPKKVDDAPQPIRSVFIIPAKPQEGRDPFFPDSMRLYKTVTPTQATIIANLSVKGFSGTPGNWTVIINNHSFGVGDEGDVIDGTGRVHVHCLEIAPGRVIIEANGQRRELNF